MVDSLSGVRRAQQCVGRVPLARHLLGSCFSPRPQCPALAISCARGCIGDRRHRCRRTVAAEEVGTLPLSDLLDLGPGHRHLPGRTLPGAPAEPSERRAPLLVPRAKAGPSAIGARGIV